MVVACSSSTLACRMTDACLYSSTKRCAVYNDARENPNRKPTILRVNKALVTSTGIEPGGNGEHRPASECA